MYLKENKNIYIYIYIYDHTYNISINTYMKTTRMAERQCMTM